MRTLATILAATAIAAIGFADPASASKPTNKVNHNPHYTSGFSAAFVADTGAEVGHSDGLGSKGDLDNDGLWGVTTGDLPGLLASASFDICVDKSGTEEHLATVGASGGVDGDLDIDATDADGSVATAGDYQQPSLRIRVADASVCTGDLLQESGTTISIDD